MRSTSGPIKVRTLPTQPHCFFFGGLDIQMHRSLELMNNVGIDAQKLDLWSRDANFDVLHCWSLDGVHRLAVEGARSYGKKIIMSALLPFTDLRGWIRHYGAIIEGRRRVQISIAHKLDKLFVHCEPQRDAAIKMFGMPREKVEIIPTILDPQLFERKEIPLLDDLSGYMACVGNIWPRKNQVRVALAAQKVGCPVIFIGNTMAGEDAYTKTFTDLIESTPFFHWYKWVSEEDLRKVLANARGVVLPSFLEVQPGAPLEGAAMGKPIMLGNRPYAKQKYYENAFLADPKSVASIAQGIENMMNNPVRFTPPAEHLRDCHPDSISREFKRIIEGLWEAA